MTQTIASYIITPDKTKLQSFHRHDYKTHTDANGEEYMIDGGLDYVRTSMNKHPAVYHTITMDDPHHLRREHFHWGTYGKQGNEPLRWVALKDMETDHIQAILDNHRPASWTAYLFEDELQWRKSHEALDKLSELSQELGDY